RQELVPYSSFRYNFQNISFRILEVKRLRPAFPGYSIRYCDSFSLHLLTHPVKIISAHLESKMLFATPVMRRRAGFFPGVVRIKTKQHRRTNPEKYVLPCLILDFREVQKSVVKFPRLFKVLKIQACL